MKRRTTIELDDDLLSRARQALGNETIHATVEEALRRLVDDAEAHRVARRAEQLGFLQQLGVHADLEVLASDEMWR